MYNLNQSLRRFIRGMNNNFTPNDYYVTLTQDDECLVDTFPESKRLLDNFIRRLQRINPKVKIMAVIYTYMFFYNLSKTYFYLYDPCELQNLWHTFLLFQYTELTEKK